MTPSEAIMWAVEKDPALRSDFGNLTILDRTPDPDRLRTKVEQALLEIPRLAERVVSPPLRIAPPEWRPDPTFDLDYHLRRIALPAPGTDRQLLDLAASISAPPFDRSRPLWEFTVIEGLQGGRAALLQRIHHTITDGVGGLRLSLSLVDLERDPAPSVQDVVREVAEEELARNLQADLSDPVHRDSPIDVVRDAFEFGAYRNLDLVRRGIVAGGSTVFHPTEIPELVQDGIRLAASIRRQLLVLEPARSKLFAPGSLARRYDLLNVSFDRARSVASAFEVSINDVFVAAVTGGIGLYHDRMGTPVDELRMAMAISTREGSGDTAANRFTPTRVLVPVGPKDPAARLRGVRARIGTLRNEPALAAADSLAGLVSGLPTSLLVALMRSQTRTIDFATSNLRGSPIELFVGGARIDATYPMGPRTGCPLNVTMISYCGQLGLGIHSDPAAVTDPDGLVDCLRESFDAVLALAR